MNLIYTGRLNQAHTMTQRVLEFFYNIMILYLWYHCVQQSGGDHVSTLFSPYRLGDGLILLEAAEHDSMWASWINDSPSWVASDDEDEFVMWAHGSIRSLIFFLHFFRYFVLHTFFSWFDFFKKSFAIIFSALTWKIFFSGWILQAWYKDRVAVQEIRSAHGVGRC